jgi:hypothetical protein
MHKLSCCNGLKFGICYLLPHENKLTRTVIVFLTAAMQRRPWASARRDQVRAPAIRWVPWRDAMIKDNKPLNQPPKRKTTM